MTQQINSTFLKTNCFWILSRSQSVLQAFHSARVQHRQRNFHRLPTYYSDSSLAQPQHVTGAAVAHFGRGKPIVLVERRDHLQLRIFFISNFWINIFRHPPHFTFITKSFFGYVLTLTSQLIGYMLALIMLFGIDIFWFDLVLRVCRSVCRMKLRVGDIGAAFNVADFLCWNCNIHRNNS